MTKTKRSKRIGPKMDSVRAYVTGNPGCSMLAAAEWVAPRGSRMYGYRTVHRAIKAGIVWSIEGAGRYRLFPIAGGVS